MQANQIPQTRQELGAKQPVKGLQDERPLKVGSQNKLNQQFGKETPDKAMDLTPCSKCSRTFTKDRISVHEKACIGKEAPRKWFNSRKQRLSGLVSGPSVAIGGLKEWTSNMLEKTGLVEPAGAPAKTDVKGQPAGGIKKMGQQLLQKAGLAAEGQAVKAKTYRSEIWRKQRSEFRREMRSAKRNYSGAPQKLTKEFEFVDAPRRSRATQEPKPATTMGGIKQMGQQLLEKTGLSNLNKPSPQKDGQPQQQGIAANIKEMGQKVLEKTGLAHHDDTTALKGKGAQGAAIQDPIAPRAK